MRTMLGSPFALAVTAFLFHSTGAAQAQVLSEAGPVPFTAEELENLLAPVALYPDPILAQVLVAASYPEEVDLAARHVGVYGQQRIDDQPWDISVKAVARYEPVLNLMADRLDWTTALGQAYAEQPEDVMAAVQSLRAMARAHGNLVTTEHHEVVVEDRYIRILPAQPRVVYVPVYDPVVVYHRPIVHLGVYRSGWSFGVGFPIGVWLVYDLDWRRRHVFYHGWDHYAYRTGWLVRSRPFIVINHVYVQPRPRVVVVNRTVARRYVDYSRFGRYNTVHRHVVWERHDGRRYARGGRSWAADGRDDPTTRHASWDRSGRMRANDDDRRAAARTAPTAQPRRAQPQQAEQRPPSWDRDGRGQRADRGATTPSSDRSARTRVNADDDRAVNRSRATQQPRQAPERVAPQPQPRPSEPRQTPSRIESRRTDTQRDQARSQPRSVAPQRGQPTQSQRAEPVQVRSERAAPQSQRQPSRPQVDRSRAQVDRSRAQSAATTRSTPSRPQRGEARSASSGRSGDTPSRSRARRGGGDNPDSS